MRRMRIAAACGLACGLALVATALAQPPAEQKPAAAPPSSTPAATPTAKPKQPTTKPAQAEQPSSVEGEYVRIATNGPVISLETAVRSMQPLKAGGPVIELVGVTHIGDKSYYSALQEFLDAQSLVLYEGVRPGGMGASEPSDDERVKLTERRVRLLAVMAERHRVKTGEYPKDVAELKAGFQGRMARYAEASMVDGWGRPLNYMVVQGQSTTPESKTTDTKAPDAKEPGAKKPPARRGMFDVFSFGADGTPGGQGLDADLKYTAQPPLKSKELAAQAEGIQSQLATGLGLEFQLTAVNYERKNWRNSDLSIDEVQKKLDEDGASGDHLFRLLDGSSFSARVLGFLLQMIKSDPKAQAQAKLMMIEALASADELMASSAAQLQVGKVMKVILHDRNEAVLADLKKVLAEEKGLKSVALFYGAGHLPEIEARLIKDFGYKPSGNRYFSAIAVDPEKANLSSEEVTRLRRLVQQAMLSGRQAKPEGK